jgi:diadenosine tetraphosphatase ApaH/serine/threonine PP2A family protein phosphatase
MELFDLLPLAALLNNEVFSVHGGLPPAILCVNEYVSLQRDCEIPREGPIADFT